MEPKRGIDGKYHLVYKTTVIETGAFYIGKHSTRVLEDGYFGSGKLIGRFIEKYGVSGLKREILFYCDSAKDAFQTEKELIGDLWKLDEDCMNLKAGGDGDWDNVNFAGLNLYGKNGYPGFGGENLKCGHTSEEASEIWKCHRSVYIEHLDKIRSSAIIAAQSESACRKRAETFKEIKHQQGEKNSQFGTKWKWINNPETKENRKIPKDVEIPDGFVIGQFKETKEKPLTKQQIKKIQLVSYYNELYEIYKLVGFDELVKQTGYAYSKQNLVQAFSKHVDSFIPQNGKRRG